MRSIMFLLLILFSGCCVLPNENEPDVNKREIAKDDPRLKLTGEKILQALQNKNYSEFAKFANEKENKITEEDFRTSEKNIREQFGKITGFEYLTDLELPLMHNMIWKVRFERKGKNQETVRQELLFRLILGSINGKPHVISMGFL